MIIVLTECLIPSLGPETQFLQILARVFLSILLTVASVCNLRRVQPKYTPTYHDSDILPLIIFTKTPQGMCVRPSCREQ
jgi:hypothetical protein